MYVRPCHVRTDKTSPRLEQDSSIACVQGLATQTPSVCARERCFRVYQEAPASHPGPVLQRNRPCRDIPGRFSSLHRALSASSLFPHGVPVYLGCTHHYVQTVRSPAVGSAIRTQGLTLVHFSAQLERLVSMG